ncbi:hypothetical protein [Acinetobacter sp. c1-l78]|uniref:hypothetical protein n=1 Tax=Acinetobacter sp. c1-l78 TaxID=3342803 RepID=UPI0035B8706B
MIRELAIEDTQVSLTEIAWGSFISAVAKYMGDELIIPDSYKEFMFKYNGGSFDEYVLNNTSAGDVSVNQFLSWDENKKTL